MRAFDWYIQNQHAFKAHEENHVTLSFGISSFWAMELHRGTKIHDSKKGGERDKKTLAMAPTNPYYTIGTKIKTKAVHVTSLAKCLRRYRANKKARILVDTVLEAEIGPKAAALGRHRRFAISRFDIGGGAIKGATINIWGVKLHTTEPPFPSTGGDSRERADATTTTTTGDTTVTDAVYVQVFEALALDPLNDEAFRVFVAQTMSKTPVRPLSPLK